MTTTLTILGSAGTHVGPGRACSGYLLESEGYRLLLDCGNGSLANLQRHLDVADLDAVVLSHAHPDHFVDLYSLYYARRFHPAGELGGLDVHAPPGAGDVVGQVLSGQDGTSGVLDFVDQVPGDVVHLGPFTAELFDTAHPIDCLASRITVGGRTFAFSGDTDDCDGVRQAARDADLFLCEATWSAARGPYPSGLHLTGSSAGAMASAAGVDRLLLTHLVPSHDRDTIAAEATETFGPSVLLADDNEEHHL